MLTFIKNRQHLRIERREWYNTLQFDISPLFRPHPMDTVMGMRMMQLENSPEAVRFFAAHCDALTDYGYWFFSERSGFSIQAGATLICGSAFCLLLGHIAKPA